jgi:hypothetical protein
MQCCSSPADRCIGDGMISVIVVQYVHILFILTKGAFMISYTTRVQITQYINNLEIKAVPQKDFRGDVIGYKICSTSPAQQHVISCNYPELWHVSAYKETLMKQLIKDYEHGKSMPFYINTVG